MGFGYLDPDPFEKDEPPTKTRRCKRCGARGLHWEELDEGWRLVTAKGEIHKCPAAKQDEFKALT